MGILGKDQDTSSSFEPFAVGPQTLEIKVAEWKETRAGNGHYLNLEMVVIKGKAKGRKVWHTLNLDNPSAEAVNISKKEAQQMVIQIHGKALDVDSIKQLQKLLKGGRVKAQIGIQESKGYDPKNVVKYFIMPKDEDDTGSGSSKEGATSDSTPPWAKKDKKKKKGKKGKK